MVDASDSCDGDGPVLIVDNHDSYTYNLVHLVAAVTGRRPDVVTNDRLDVATCLDGRYSHVVISPGPGHPAVAGDYGDCLRLTREARIPLLGVCLGHQGLAVAFGGTVDRIRPAHGLTTRVTHDGERLFRGVPQGFAAVRYHSLAVVEVPDDLVVTARGDDGTIMGLRHRDRELHGVQFHPESVLTEHGLQLMGNFLGRRPAHRRVRRAAAVHRPARAVAGRGRATVRRLDQWIDPEDLVEFAHGQSDRVVWLDSSSVRDWSGRFSYVAWLDRDDPSFTYEVGTRTLLEHHRGGRRTTDADLFEQLAARLAADRAERPAGTRAPFDFHGGWIGYVGYECRALTTGGPVPQASSPDACFLRVARFFAFDNLTRTVYAVSHDPDAHRRLDAMRQVAAQLAAAARPGRRYADAGPPAHAVEPPSAAAPADPRLRRRYDASFARVQEHLRAGNSYEVNLTYRQSVASAMSPWQVYRRLRRLNPAPYGAYLAHPSVDVLCTSPERFLTVDRSGHVETKPIKGTMPRDPDPLQDAANARTLATGQRFQSENLMIVDLLRNDLGTVCRLGSISVPRLMDVETYANVHQLVTTVRGRLAENGTAVDALRALFPPGSMTGAPKIRTTRIIDEVEEEARGVYSGVIGWLGFDGRADLAVLIRTLVHRDGVYTLGVGGGVTVMSDADSEYAETRWKADRLLAALAPEPPQQTQPFIASASAPSAAPVTR